ncbi:hypothetical protein D7Z26_24875 [Cohnella endophytica]|uniref:Uncharacterized protein n=1 Tax=Cohnella endophytica TaxID=2419778 RepID=A0A494X9H7_9BACL|nr:hypothetical protein [Cohnella endophytica]RKP46311.1 hypothetical protein D7Z26_24875 [Cohnella endophytica]
MCEYDKYFKTYEGTPRSYRSSVHFNDFRLRKAMEQAKLEPVAVEQVIEYINAFLAAISMNQIESPIVRATEINYKKIKDTNNLTDKRDIVWLKFTKDGFIGVVATSDDVNFNIPESKDVYHDKDGNSWRYNTSGIIVHSVDQEWDESFVLIYPLRNIPDGLTRHDIEKGIGNYLINNRVPILDFYSHNY